MTQQADEPTVAAPGQADGPTVAVPRPRSGDGSHASGDSSSGHASVPPGTRPQSPPHGGGYASVPPQGYASGPPQGWSSTPPQGGGWSSMPPQGGGYGSAPTQMAGGAYPYGGQVPPAGTGGPGVPPPGWSPATPPKRRGRTIALVVGLAVLALVGILVLVVALAGLGGDTTSSAPPAPVVSAPASPVVPAPSDTAAERRATQRSFDAAGVRLNTARTVLDQRMDAASKKGDLPGFRSAAGDFSRELGIYKTAVAGLAMPADQQAAFTGTLLPTVDRTIANADAMARSTGAQQLKTAAGAFDQSWGVLVDTHNAIDRALAL